MKILLYFVSGLVGAQPW